MKENFLTDYYKEVSQMAKPHDAETCSIKEWPKEIGKKTNFKFNAVIHVHALAISSRYPGFVRSTLKYFSKYYKVMWIGGNRIQDLPFIDFIKNTSQINECNMIFHDWNSHCDINQSIKESNSEFVFIDVVNQSDTLKEINLKALIKRFPAKRFILICRHFENECRWNEIKWITNRLITAHMHLYVNTDMAYKIINNNY